MSAALAAMVANLTQTKPSRHDDHAELEEWAVECQNLKDHLLRSIDEDTDAFNDVLVAMRLPKGTKEERARRDEAIEAGYKNATRVPLRTAVLCLESMRVCAKVARKGLEASITDAGVGAFMGRAGILGAIYNVKINLGSIRDRDWVTTIEAQLEKMIDEADMIVADVRAFIDDKIGS
jgi:glutamate formiminotransferase/formiminotetrahydrofolate cyclodeaminase